MKQPYGKKVLVTGGTSGIGEAIANLFAENGYEVYASSRRATEKTVKVGSGIIRYLKMDVRDANSIRDAVGKLPSDVGIVVHAAGFGIGGAAEDTPIYSAREQMETNYFGVLSLNQELLPRFRQLPHSLVIAISSIGGRVALPYQSHYSSSKYALEAYIEALGMEARPFGVRTVLLEPGDTRTGFTGKRESVLPEGSPYEAAYKRALEQIEHDELSGDSPMKAAKAALKCASSLNPPVRIPIGLDYKALMVLLRVLPDKAKRFILSTLYHC